MSPRESSLTYRFFPLLLAHPFKCNSSLENQTMRLFFALALCICVFICPASRRTDSGFDHRWSKQPFRLAKTTMMMKKYLEDTKRYKVDVARTKYTWQGDQLLEKYPLNDGVQREALKQAKPDPDFKPDFSKYQVVISNFGFGAAKWPEKPMRLSINCGWRWRFGNRSRSRQQLR